MTESFPRAFRSAVVQRKQAGTANPAVVAYLQTALADAWVLYANYKHYHWQLYGPQFRDFHLMFDEFADGYSIDDLAERLRRLGANVDNVQLREFQAGGERNVGSG